ncbi:MAG: SDR family oxidoreductase [Paracoccaceae bacterium]|nr:SDR family oxidoreductase [Paracoccaceae bacterium]MDG1371281.1 SDR family oxidoreductase [Paracoccaceae bacterium]
MTKGIALVTGASAGIGAATATALAEDGWTVHATARRLDRLEALAAKSGAIPHQIDVTDCAAMGDMIASTKPDLLVANAGLGGGMTGLTDADADEIETVVHTNVTAMIQTTKAAMEGMAVRGRGHIITVGSVSGLYATGAALYGATKHAVRGFVRNMRLDPGAAGIRFTDIQPGRVATEFYDVAVVDDAVRDQIKDTGIEELTPEDVAEAIRWVAAQPAHVNISALEITPRDQAYGGVKFTR